MNQFILGILKVYGIATIIYLLYLVFIKITKRETIEIILEKASEQNVELINKYKKIKRVHAMVFILGVLIGLTVLILGEPDKILDKIKLSIKESISNVVSDISDISVL